jgi:kynurenine formamidase
MQLPDYDSLPEASRGGRSGWGLFTKDDSIGLMNLIGNDQTLAAVRLVQLGEVISLNAPLAFISPPLFSRSPLVIDRQTTRQGRGLEDVYNGFNPQASSQWDTLGHAAYDFDSYYDGATLADVLDRGRHNIDHLARRGVVTRGVVLDVERVALERDPSYSPGTSFAFTVDDIERARLAAGVEFRVGDIILLRTGFIRWYESLSSSEREQISTREGLRACGLEHTEEMARYLWNTHAAAVATDCPALEVWPMDHSDEKFPFGMMHRIILGQFGLWIGELWALDVLTDRCAQIERHEVLITSAPLNAPGSISSPANALAVL